MFVLCILYRTINAAMTHYKQIMCLDQNNTANYDKTFKTLSKKQPKVKSSVNGVVSIFS